ncbi:hypothetical protein D3OALGA1CA_5922 [Olavius algarvensis associated proteobacterium Delta 3]|nr:hypothetical protein D3OALGA1CA_5922 [Olavius algarvensis associated proteobacterium Delta 3]
MIYLVLNNPKNFKPPQNAFVYPTQILKPIPIKHQIWFKNHIWCFFDPFSTSFYSSNSIQY